jgi:hypothetical protein
MILNPLAIEATTQIIMRVVTLTLKVVSSTRFVAGRRYVVTGKGKFIIDQWITTTSFRHWKIIRPLKRVLVPFRKSPKWKGLKFLSKKN